MSRAAKFGKAIRGAVVNTNVKDFHGGSVPSQEALTHGAPPTKVNTVSISQPRVKFDPSTLKALRAAEKGLEKQIAAGATPGRMGRLQENLANIRAQITVEERKR